MCPLQYATVSVPHPPTCERDGGIGLLQALWEPRLPTTAGVPTGAAAARGNVGAGTHAAFALSLAVTLLLLLLLLPLFLLLLLLLLLLATLPLGEHYVTQ